MYAVHVCIRGRFLALHSAPVRDIAAAGGEAVVRAETGEMSAVTTAQAGVTTHSAECAGSHASVRKEKGWWNALAKRGAGPERRLLRGTGLKASAGSGSTATAAAAAAAGQPYHQLAHSGKPRGGSPHRRGEQTQQLTRR